VIRQLRAALGNGFPIIGVGGILSAEDALSKIRAGPTWCRSTPA
jgi:dihydroorotate dehydrogenase